MIARVSALAVSIIFPFVAKNDIRYYLNGVNIRPLEGGGVMLIATDGRRFIVIRDPNGFADRELIVQIDKDAIKHAKEASATLDILSNGEARILDVHAVTLFIQPGRSLIEDTTFPRIENIVNLTGYTEGISGVINPKFLDDALQVNERFGGIQFFTRTADDPLLFVYSGLSDMECFGGIMKLRDVFQSLPTWFPRRGIPTTLAEV